MAIPNSWKAYSEQQTVEAEGGKLKAERWDIRTAKVAVCLERTADSGQQTVVARASGIRPVCWVLWISFDSSFTL
jgi:hypothetical protein